MPGEMELKPGEIVFLPDGSGASRGAFSVPHPLPLGLPHPLLSICSSEGSVVITNPGGEPPSAAGHTKPWGWPLVWSPCTFHSGLACGSYPEPRNHHLAK